MVKCQFLELEIKGGVMNRFLMLLLVCFSTTALAQQPLPSWHDTASKRAIVAFVNQVTEEGSPDYVAVPDRIAVFDNDGTLWSEQPIYVQLAFALDRVKALAPANPQWQTTQPFEAVLQGDMATVFKGGEAGLMQLVAATHADMTREEFEQTVREWLAQARHPVTGRAYTEMVYQPMLELLDYLRAAGFKTYIVSGGGVDFMRAWAEDFYGVPPEQVIGSSLKSEFVMRDGEPMVVRTPEVGFINDKAGKPVAIDLHIGKRPLMAFGNSDGDFEMLQWVTAGSGPRFGLIVHHTDDVREVAYDRQSKVGRLDRALQAASEEGWIVVDMKTDWAQVFAHD